MTVNFSFDEKINLNFEKRAQRTLKSLRLKIKDENDLLFHLIPKQKELNEISTTADEIIGRSNTLIVAGIGGSSLAGKVFASIKNEREILFFEGIEPRKIARAEKSIDFKKCFLNIVSKSGNTTETLVNSAFLLKKIKEANGENWKEKVLLSASEGEGVLLKWAKKEKIKILEIPSQVGGRFSAFTVAGLIPALYSGLDPNKIAKGAQKGLENGLSLELNSNLAFKLSQFYLSAYRKNLPNLVLWGYGKVCHLLSLWIQQLWAESLGKKKTSPSGEIKTGILPVALKGSEDQHSILQFLREGRTPNSVLFISENYKGEKLSAFEKKFCGFKQERLHYGEVQNALKEGTKRSLEKDNFLISEFSLSDASEETISETMALFIVSTLIISDFLKINPFGQNGVEEGKKITKSLLF